MAEGRSHRYLATAGMTAIAAALWLVPAALAAYDPGGPRADVTPAASQPNQQLIAFLQSHAGVATEVVALVLAAVAWTVGIVRWLERVETANRVPTTKSARKRARQSSAATGRPAITDTIPRILVGLVTAATLLLPLTFSVLIPDNVFALPKTLGLTAFGAVMGVFLIGLLAFRARPSRPGVVEISAIAFITLTAIATLASVDPAHSVVGEPTHYQGLIAAIDCVLLFTAAGTSLTTLVRVRILALAILTSATVAALYALVQWLGFDPIWAELYKGRVFSTVGQANALATTLAAGAIMTAVFLGFVTDPDVVVKTIGLGLASAILIDVLIVRMVVAPAVMALLGDRAWGLPRWLDRILPRISLEGEPAPARA